MAEEPKKPRRRVNREVVLRNAVERSSPPTVIQGPDWALDALREARKEAYKTEQDMGEWDLGEVARQIAFLARASQFIAFRLGRMYTVAYQLCAVEGPEFRQWVEALGCHGYSHARALMRVYKLCLGREENAEHIPNTILVKICQAGFPEDLREQILACGVDEDVRVREIVEAGVKVAAGEWSLMDPEVRRLLPLDAEGRYGSVFATVLRKVQNTLRDAIKRLKELPEDELPKRVQKSVTKALKLFTSLNKSIGWLPPDRRRSE